MRDSPGHVTARVCPWRDREVPNPGPVGALGWGVARALVARVVEKEMGAPGKLVSAASVARGVRVCLQAQAQVVVNGVEAVPLLLLLLLFTGAHV